MVVVCKSERAPDLAAVLTRINLIVDDDAGMLPPPGLRALDAIHLVAAQRTSTPQGWAARNVSFGRPADNSSTSKGRSRRA
jgi:hypothetical protein